MGIFRAVLAATAATVLVTLPITAASATASALYQWTAFTTAYPDAGVTTGLASNGVNVAMAWVDDATGEARAKFSPDGGVTWGATRVYSDPGDTVVGLKVAAYGSDGFTFSYVRYGTDDVVLRNSNPEGTLWTAPAHVTVPDPLELNIVSVGDTRNALVVRGILNSHTAAYVFISDENGLFTAQPSIITAADGGNLWDPQLWSDGDQLTVLWSDGPYADIVEGAFTRDFGASWTPLDSFQQPSGVNSLTSRSCSGDIFVAGEYTSGTGAIAVHSGDGSGTWSDVSPSSLQRIDDSAFGCLSDGRMLAVWNTYNGDTGAPHWALFDRSNSGWSVSEEGVLPDEQAGSLNLAALPNGGVLLTHSTSSDAGNDVFGIVFDPSTGWGESERLTQTDLPSSTGWLVPTTLGAALVVQPFSFDAPPGATLSAAYTHVAEPSTAKDPAALASTGTAGPRLLASALALVGVSAGVLAARVGLKRRAALTSRS